MDNPLISIIITTYNSERYIESCIKSIIDQRYTLKSLFEIIVIDNSSTDSTVNIIRNNFPQVLLIDNDKNPGYGSANNLGVSLAKGEYLIIINPDTVVEEGWLEGLVMPLTNSGKLITTPKILVYDGTLINTCGNVIHTTGLAFTRGYNSLPNTFQNPEYINGISGCCFAIKKNDFLNLGGFDESIFLYYEDVDLSFRAHLSGFKILYVPNSRIKHDYTLKVSPEKIYYLEKGRYRALKKYFSANDILLLMPSLLVAEILTFGYALRVGSNGIRYKLKAVIYGLTVKVEQMEGNRYNLIKSLSYTIPAEQLTSNFIEKYIKIIANMVFKLNARLFN